ncbi:tail fiber assembly protein [Providencia huaxiensis]|uniref:tail fiber assembly protein n=1 Tax=Providencia huaxiensis TaxID=2027290 RepID=UPI0034DCF34D
MLTIGENGFQQRNPINQLKHHIENYPALTLLVNKTTVLSGMAKSGYCDTEAKAALVAQAEQEKAQKLGEANATIMYLQDAIEVGLDDDDYDAKIESVENIRVYLTVLIQQQHRILNGL